MERQESMIRGGKIVTAQAATQWIELMIRGGKTVTAQAGTQWRDRVDDQRTEDSNCTSNEKMDIQS